MIALVGCIIIVVVLGLTIVLAGIANDKVPTSLFVFGVVLSILSITGYSNLLSLEESIDNNSQYIPAEPLAYNQTQTVFTTDEGTYLANGLYPDGTYLLTVDGKDVLVVWQAVDGEIG